MLEIGTCAGIENYSRHLSGRGAGERPACLFDYFPEDFLVVIDESHVTLPQIGGMYNGDRARKLTLVEYGFRLPSALDNRPLDVRRVSGADAARDQRLGDAGRAGARAVAGRRSSSRSSGRRDSIDPEIEVRPVRGQVDDLLDEIRIREREGERVLVTTLTKRMAEDLTDYLQQVGVRVRYMHSDIDAIERMEILRGLRLGEFDVLVGHQPAARRARSARGVAGRDPRRGPGRVSAERPVADPDRRPRGAARGRARRSSTPIGSRARCSGRSRRPRAGARCSARTTSSTASRRAASMKSVDQVRFITRVADARADARGGAAARRRRRTVAAAGDRAALIARLEEEMQEAAAALDFETAARLRDELFEIRAASGGPLADRLADLGGSAADPPVDRLAAAIAARHRRSPRRAPDAEAR